MLHICAVVVTKDPDPGLLNRMKELRGSVERIILVDNGSSESSIETIKQVVADTSAQVIWNRENLGVAAALNMGARMALEDGYDWILTLDQDSEPATDMIKELFDTYHRNPNKETIGIIAPKVIDSGVGREALFLKKKTKWIYQRVQCDDGDIEDITTVITSGAMINSPCFKALNGFREDFFIDYVDTEFCLRAILAGFRIVVSCKATLNHTFGARVRFQRGPLVLYPSFHSPERWYTISRNRVSMISSFGSRLPHWLMYEIVATLYILFRMLLTEDQKRLKLKAIIVGTWDGMRGKYGPPPWSSKHETR